MTMITPSMTPTAQMQSNVNLAIKAENNMLSFGDLFSNALVKNKSQLDSANQTTLEKGQEVAKKTEVKKADSKSHSVHSEKPAAPVNTDPNAAGANAQMLQGNLNKSELSQNNSDNFNHLQSDTSMGETGPSSNQQAFLAVQAKQGMPATEATDTDSSLASSNATHFAQLLSPQTENPGLNLISNSPSIISAAVISANVSITGTNSLSSAKTSLAAVDPILTGGVQSDPNTLALESNSEINQANTSPKLSIAPALGEGPWAAALGQQALFIAKNQMSTAQLTLNPEHLGPIQVTLDMKHDQASATFVSPHDAVRQAIEASLPQLRDMFTQAGLQLGQTQIQSNLDGQFAQQSQQNQNSFANRSGAVSTSTASTETIPTSNISAASSATRVSSGLLDTFA